MTVATGFGAATTTFGAHVLILRRSVKGSTAPECPDRRADGKIANSPHNRASSRPLSDES